MMAVGMKLAVLVLMMVTVQVAFTGVNISFKLTGSTGTGLSIRVLIAYRFMFATAFMIPLALLYDNWKEKRKVTWKVFLVTFVCALIGGPLQQNLYAEALELTSPTVVVAMANLVPALTFFIAILFKMETLGLNSCAGRAKVVGTCLCIAGAMLLTFYKGIDIKIWSTHFDLLQKTQHYHKSDNIFGSVLALFSCFCTSLGFILQAEISKIYPHPISTTAMTSVIGAAQATFYALCKEKDWEQWRLGWSINLLVAAYMGIIATGVVSIFILYCVRIKGPIFVSIFNPVQLVLIALASSLLLNEKLHLGSVVGGVIMVMGLVSVLWGKTKETMVPRPSQETRHADTANSEAFSATESFNGSSNEFEHAIQMYCRDIEEKTPSTPPKY